MEVPLLFPHTNAIHMYFMHISIDAWFLRAATETNVYEVLATRTLRPWQWVPFVRGTQAVLELAAGETDRLSIKAGDCVKLSPVVPRAGY